MRSLKLQVFFFSIFLLPLFSCRQEVAPLAEFGPVFEHVMRSDTGSFRGLELGASMNDVMAMEESEPSEVDDLHLYYEYTLPEPYGTYDISYDFDENGLTEIHSDISISEASLADSVYAAFKKYFDRTYGSGENHGGFNVWTVRSESFGQVRINLSDGSADPAAGGEPGKISLWIYLEKE